MNNQPLNEKDVASHNDWRLRDIALYHESRGMTHCVEAEKVRDRFIEFKGLVKRGSFTIDELEKRVFVEYGIVEEDPNAIEALGLSDKISKNFLDIMDDMVDKIAKKNKKSNGDNV